MSRQDDEAKLRALGWVEDCGGQWHAPWMKPGTWINFELASAFSVAAEMTDSTRDLARAAVESNDRRNAELEAMSPEDREKAIEAWAKQLAEDVCALDD